MRAMVMDAARHPVRLADIPRPAPEAGQVLIAVRACGVCRTDLHVLDGELPNPKLPLVLGHEIIGTVAATGGGPGVIRSVANLTRKDGEEFLALAPKVPVRTEVEPYPLERADEALEKLRAGRVRGAAALVVGQSDGLTV